MLGFIAKELKVALCSIAFEAVFAFRTAQYPSTVRVVVIELAGEGTYVK